MRLPSRPRRFALRIRSKFLLVFAILVPLIFAAPMVGIYGLTQLRDQGDKLYYDNVRTTLLAQNAAGHIDDGFELALRLIPAKDPAYQRRLERQLAVVDAQVERDIARLRSPRPDDTAWERAAVERLDAGWRRFVNLWQTDGFDHPGHGEAVTRQNDATARKLAGILSPVSALANELSARQGAEARETQERRGVSYRTSRRQMLGFAAIAVLAALTALLWLVRDIVPRTRSYSRFAAGVASGAASEPIDHFKHVNDTYGHGKGDEVLAGVGAVLQTTVRDTDVAGRWGGEEFMILLADVDRNSARIAAEKIRTAVAKLKIVGVEQSITASIGVAVLPDDGTDVATLLRNADRALYAAKAAGRNRVEMFTAESGNGKPAEGLEAASPVGALPRP